MKEIELTRGETALVDDADYKEIGKYSWHCTSHGYAARKDTEDKSHYLHRDIMKPQKGFVVDHIDGNKLNNTRKNLRVITQTKNTWNSLKTRGEVPYRGVYNTNKWYQDQGWSLKKPYAARIQVNGKEIWLGRFATAEEARDVYLANKAKFHII